jgi:hypothetical protein
LLYCMVRLLLPVAPRLSLFHGNARAFTSKHPKRGHTTTL